LIVPIFFIFLVHCSQPAPECAVLENGIKDFPLRGESLGLGQISLGIEVDSVSIAEDVSNYLSVKGVPAIFFVEGKKIGNAGYEASLRSIYIQGHRLGNIGYSEKEVQKNQNLEMQFRSVDYILTRIQSDSLFFMRFSDNDYSRSKHLNAFGLGKYIGPLGSSLSGLGNLVRNYCESKEQEQICVQEVSSYIQAAKKGLVIFPILTGQLGAGTVLKSVISRLQQVGIQFVAIQDIPEISREISLRKESKKSRSCDDYSRN